MKLSLKLFFALYLILSFLWGQTSTNAFPVSPDQDEYTEIFDDIPEDEPDDAVVPTVDLDDTEIENDFDFTDQLQEVDQDTSLDQLTEIFRNILSSIDADDLENESEAVLNGLVEAIFSATSESEAISVSETISAIIVGATTSQSGITTSDVLVAILSQDQNIADSEIIEGLTQSGLSEEEAQQALDDAKKKI